ncbi:hypothetical protein GCM10022254_24400 [Actinomadura meridiana]|uniref:Uncharacterized protein n=1 Tax=Actinomadura meridiana TaxID=559626 RepID=A0ABP8BYJ5_9ACTN
MSDDVLDEAAKLLDTLISPIGGDVGRHLRDAADSLLAAVREVVAPEASESPTAGRSERSDRHGTGEPWSAATGGGPTDIG